MTGRRVFTMYVDYINVVLLPASFIGFVLLNSTFVPVSNFSHKLTNSCVNMLTATVRIPLSGTEECEDVSDLIPTHKFKVFVIAFCFCVMTSENPVLAL